VSKAHRSEFYVACRSLLMLPQLQSTFRRNRTHCKIGIELGEAQMLILSNGEALEACGMRRCNTFRNQLTYAVRFPDSRGSQREDCLTTVERTVGLPYRYKHWASPRANPTQRHPQPGSSPPAAPPRRAPPALRAGPPNHTPHPRDADAPAPYRSSDRQSRPLGCPPEHRVPA
jgi:hypothetical protein